MQQSKLLAVFDFDHTLVDGNTDTWVTKLLLSTMQLIREHQKKGWCWTDVMDKVFGVLHVENLTKEDYEKCFETLQFTEGMKEACQFLQTQKVPTIIISDSNSYFIDHILERDFLRGAFCGVYTNPARWESSGRLHVEQYHEHDCNHCPPNLCKSTVLQKYLNDCHQHFKHIVYVGDGHGDLCPCLTLKEDDYILARKGYKLLDCLQGEESSEVNAEVIPWTTGFEALQLFQKLCDA